MNFIRLFALVSSASAVAVGLLACSSDESEESGTSTGAWVAEASAPTTPAKGPAKPAGSAAPKPTTPPAPSPPDAGTACEVLEACCAQMLREGYPTEATECRAHVATKNAATCTTWLGTYETKKWCNY